jgi:hypothetical protein
MFLFSNADVHFRRHSVGRSCSEPDFNVAVGRSQNAIIDSHRQLDDANRTNCRQTQRRRCEVRPFDFSISTIGFRGCQTSLGKFGGRK